jgi:hypothetical protein
MSKINLMMKKDDNFPLSVGSFISFPSFSCPVCGIESTWQHHFFPLNIKIYNVFLMFIQLTY